MSPAPGAPAARGPALGILTRAPQPGRTKTRLAGAIGDAAAADLATAMLLDTVEAVSAGDWQTTLFVEPAAGLEAVRRLLEASSTAAERSGQVDLRPQAPGDIGARMGAAALTLLHAGWAPVVLVGSDIPGLGRAQIATAVSTLSGPALSSPDGSGPPGADVVFGPADDGGYYLVGLRRLRTEREAALFGPTIAWGTGAVLAQSEAVAARAGLRVGRVDAQSDIDTIGDLVRLRTRLATADTHVRIAGPRTRAVVATLHLDTVNPHGARPAANEEQSR